MRISLVWRAAAASCAIWAFSFQAAMELPLSQVGFAAVAVATADFNRDGVTDVVAVNAGAGGSSIGILLGTRGAGPGGLTEMPLEGSATEVAASDFTGDGTADVAVLTTTSGGSRVCLFPGTGTGTFNLPVCSPAAGFPSRMTVADLNRDGRMDLVMLRPLDGTVATYLGAADGLFTPGPTASTALPAAAAVADWNGDGVADVAVAGRTGVLTLLLSGGNMLFQSSQTTAISGGVTDVAALDLNRDGRPDLVWTDPQAATIAYALGRNEAAAYLGTAVTANFPARAMTLRPVDLNGDRTMELLAATGAGVMAIASNADGSLLLPNPPGAQPSGTGALGVGDMNGDGRVDAVVIATGTAGTTGYFLPGQATGTVTALEIAPATSGYGQKTQATVRVGLAATAIPLLPLGTASVQIWDGASVLQTLPIQATVIGPGELATVRTELMLPAGVHDVTARFVGTGTYGGSVSAPVRATVAPSTSFVRFQNPPAEVSYTNGLRVNATVIGPLALANEGVVRMTVNGTVVGAGLVNNGVSQLFIPPGQPLGEIRVSLAYEGTNFLPSVSDEVEYTVKGGTVTAASAASYRAATAPDSLAVLGVPGLVRPAATADSLPWPTVLNRVQVEIRDLTGGAAVRAGLVYVGTAQVNVYLPAETPLGTRQAALLLDGVEVATGEIRVEAAAPGLLSAAGTGAGAAAAYAALYRKDGSIVPQPVFACGNGQCTTLAMDLGDVGDKLVVTVFGTGLRRAKTVTATVDGIPAEILFAGAQPETPGLDQANIVVPRELGGRGEVSVAVLADGLPSNGVRVSVR
ncbi:MAG TPA: FG-GAP-like repeat-containing protein [Bryobacteraceae bacterium]|nr:FG-GAP-like repeat-containing protein [Bryobacteraceae bacterium]